MTLLYEPRLLAAPFASFTPESFHAHVMGLKRVPARSSKLKRPPKLPSIRAKLIAKARLLELSSGSVMYPLAFSVTKLQRKSFKHVMRSEIALASRMLLQPEGAIIALLEKKKFILEPL